MSLGVLAWFAVGMTWLVVGAALRSEHHKAAFMMMLAGAMQVLSVCTSEIFNPAAIIWGAMSDPSEPVVIISPRPQLFTSGMVAFAVKQIVSLVAWGLVATSLLLLAEELKARTADRDSEPRVV